MIPNEFNLKDKTVIISGASRGLGKGIVRVFAEAGAKVLVTARTDKYLGPLAEELAAAGHPIETMTSDATARMSGSESSKLQSTNGAILMCWSTRLVMR